MIVTSASVRGGSSTATDGAGRVANQQPDRTRAKPATVAAVMISSRNTAPSAIATTGLTNVMIVARAGPISSINRKKTTNARPVQMNARPNTDSVASALGMVDGSDHAAIGA